MSLVETEHVLVVPTALFRSIGYFQGFSRNVQPYLETLLQAQHGSYRPRAEMETNPDFKQLIPYVVFRYVDQTGATHIFQYTRGAGQGEKRLHAKVSIGVGGHISSTDQLHEDHVPYREGMQRELDEEVIVRTPFTESIVGMINDDETDVGRVHLGVVHLADVELPEVMPREDEILEAGFRPLEEVRAARERMESWSRICFDGLFPEND